MRADTDLTPVAVAVDHVLLCVTNCIGDKCGKTSQGKVVAFVCMYSVDNDGREHRLAERSLGT